MSTSNIHNAALASVIDQGLAMQYRNGARYGQQLARARAHYAAEVQRLEHEAGVARWAARIAEAKQILGRV